ncbi:MAG: AMP-binding protein [Haloarculaceae archaeon]
MAKTTTHVDLDTRIDTYHFYEREWEEYEQLFDAFEHDIPEQFNLTTYLCDRWADADPERVAVHALDADGTRTRHTYGELRRDANRLAGYLANAGVDTGDRIAVSGAQKVECLLAHLAAWKLGAISVPLSLLFGPDGLEYRLANSGASAFIVDEAALPALREVEPGLDDLETKLVVGDGSIEDDEIAFHDAIADDSADVETATTDAHDPAVIMYTSGTTGSPKGVVHAHRSLLGALPGQVLTRYNMDVRADDVLYTPGEWSWGGPLFDVIMSGLYLGVPIVGDADPEFDPEGMLELIARFGVSIVGGPATVWRALMQVPEADKRYDLGSLRVVFNGGEALGGSIVDWLHEMIGDVAVHEVYGQTETATTGAGDCEALGIDHRDGYMGKPVPGQEIEILDVDEADPLGPEEVGELAVRYDGNPACFLKFWNAPEKTARRIDDSWLRTEDLGSQSADGYLSFHSRKDDVINSSGYRIGPAEIEECLAGHDAVADAGVIGVPDEMRGEVPKGFVVLAEGDEPTDDLSGELQAHVKSRLAKYEYPRELEFVSELPKTTTGKVRRHDLRVREGLVEAK